MSIRSKLILFISFLFISAIGNALLTFQLEKYGEEKLEWVNHTNEVIIDINEFLSHLKDTETGQRGYLLTGDISYLEPYHDGLGETLKHFAHLKELTSDNPLQQKRLDSVKKLMHLKFDELALTIKLKQNQNGKGDEALAIVRQNKGKQYMDDIRNIFEEFLQTEMVLLKQRKGDIRENRAKITTVIIIEIMFFVFLAFITILFLNKNLFSPLKLLLSSTQKMEAGEKVDIAGITSNDEMGYLLSSFFKMYKKVGARTELLTKTNSLFKEAQKLTRLGSWEWDISNNKLMWSDEIYRIFGLKPQEFAATYDAFINTIHIDDRASVQEYVNKALQTGEDYSMSHRIVLPDGTEKIVSEKGQVELNENKEPVRMIGTVHDITERFKRNKELEVQSKILNSVTDSILVHNLDGTMVYVNESAYTTREYTKDELMHMKIQDLDYHDEKISGKVFEENIKEIQKQLKDKNQAIFEVSHKTKNGTIIPLEITTRIIHEDNNSYMISIARDISERKTLHKNLESSEKQYRELVENSQIGIFNTHLNGEIIYANESLINIMGYESQKEFYKQHAVARYKNPEQRAHFLRELTENGKVNKMELEVLTKENEDRIIQVSAHIEGDILSGIIMDITQSKKAIEEITKLSKAIEEIDDIIMISDRAGILTFVNDAYVSHTGYSREKSIGKTAAILKSGKHDKDYYKNLWKEILSGNVFRGLIINRKKDGELYYEEKTITPIKNDAGAITSFVSTGKDITERIKMQQDLEKLASTDNLTGIYNRHKFEELFKIELDRVARYKHPLTLIMFDIDHFKNVNDTYGHDVGDEVLKNIVNVVRKNIRNTDIFVRWGGEEFIILCPETETQKATNFAEKLRSAIETTLFAQAGNITCSFGVTSYIDKEIDDSFLKRVDNALYKAKNEGRNRVLVI